MKNYTPRIKETYNKGIVAEMMKKFSYSNINEVPRLEKIVINLGLNEAKENIKVVDIASAEMGAIAGQKPKLCKAKKSISNFKIRQGMPIGLKVTLRGDRMYEFFDRLVNVAIPRIRDFRGLEPNSFDGQGNYNLGLTEQYIFPEINVEKSDKTRGMNITIVTSAINDSQARELLVLLGMPFKKRDQENKKARE
ncbi:MAG TPA: 50S ribosomal protein L5 [Elusimicrobia bacterium]|nr:MAG: 50S ribosomal protein L5 [Elusimicrobia bacterium RIFOXYA12_FULL_49_49]OGS06136.1 MAG: 50S ribosomal protein L5 [Elusimicrobia bacterium RIFOXYA1_FULL_47_7]OGS14599.1 MAG: 50S ribosomal protein L5 [Elusimicrobia bacterium RIFOXYA2_FULL_47_53]OGS25748.1 MAG: 50S ribosomal protein L5 [Elusimicrobia bacterium RIFOXYB12_FULL_50_12]OGS31690.1 MAG: 50S ribosomal protein L5 [Elusimicrobia bacterium RIFOXYB2_FULL_46_23]HBU69787.1 50S ribosomal protein L5 [Elusimicrobiota bacterium]